MGITKKIPGSKTLVYFFKILTCPSYNESKGEETGHIEIR